MNDTGATTGHSYDLGYTENGGTLTPPFFDGRVQLKQNLIFQLRAGIEAQFMYYDQSGGFATNPPAYAYSGFYSISRSTGYDPIHGTYNYYSPDIDYTLPYANNYAYRNFIFEPLAVDSSGRTTNGFDILAGAPHPLEQSMPRFQFAPPITSNTVPLLATNSTKWLVTDLLDTVGSADDLIGLTETPSGGNTIFTMGTSAQNWFGLPFISAAIAYGPNDAYQVNAGRSITVSGTNASFVYPEVAQPKFQTVEYDFWNPQQFPSYDPAGDPASAEIPVPGMPGFAPTNTSQDLFVSVGSSIQVAGYAKLAVTNSLYTGVYGYLGQYFDQAYKFDTNSMVTTNVTGLLSPYGNFFATEPGDAALVTMPDVDSGARGTGVIHCVSMNVDKNHDGTIDLTYGGPDTTSEWSPMVCWINNGYTIPGTGGGYDKDLPLPPNHPEYKNYVQGKITCPRDLENFFRLWINGVPQLPASQGYTVTLSMTAVKGNPAINLYEAADYLGGTGYLTDTNAAANQARTTLDGTGNPEFGIALATINSQQSYTLPAPFSGYAYLSRYLFEGAGVGLGTLTLTISQNGNTLCQSSVWLDLHDIGDLYEQAHATNVTSGLPPSSLVSRCVIDHTTTTADAETKQVIVFVHGINNTIFNYYDSTETIYKRLYWSGYHGKVAGFSWPCAYLPFENTLNPFNFNIGEFYAWKSAVAFRGYLNYLRGREDLTNYAINILAHSQGNVVASEAVRQGAPFDNYILTQGAVPAMSYDPSKPYLQELLDAETNQPTPIDTADGGYNGYFSGVSGNLINFYNTNDYALQSGTWLGLQANWVEDQRTQKPESRFYPLGPKFLFLPPLDACYRFYSDGHSEQITDTVEVMAMVARSRTKAVGAQENMGGVINTNKSVDLRAAFNFGKTRDEHSAQVSRPIQTAWQYYDQVLTSYNLQHIAR